MALSHVIALSRQQIFKVNEKSRLERIGFQVQETFNSKRHDIHKIYDKSQICLAWHRIRVEAALELLLAQSLLLHLNRQSSQDVLSSKQ
jgi:hypothetical protein